MIIRPFLPEDYPEVSKWFTQRKWPRSPKLSHLPATGWIVEKDEKRLAAAWLYLTNSDMALLEWSVTNPSESPFLCLRAMQRLADYIVAESQLLQPPVDVIIQLNANKKFADFYIKHCGFKFLEDTTMLGWVRED